MSLLLDTHTLFWWVTGSPMLSSKAKTAITGEGRQCYVSSVSVFELSNKVRLGKFEAAREVVERFEFILATDSFTPLPLAVAHAKLAGQLASPHRDPFDRLLVAQSIVENCEIVTADPALAALGARTIW